MQKQRRSREVKSIVNPNPQTYITMVTDIFLHPCQLLYIIVDTEGQLRMFDLPTMSLIGKSFIKLQDGYSIYKCMFSQDDVGLFYTLCRKSQQDLHLGNQNDTYTSAPRPNKYTYILNMHCLTRKGEILSTTCQVNLNDSDSKIETEPRIGVQALGRLCNPSASLTSYEKMQKDREKFILSYYSEEQNLGSAPSKWGSSNPDIRQIVQEDQDFSGKEDPPIQIEAKRQRGATEMKEEPPAFCIEGNKRSHQHQGCLQGSSSYYLRLYSQILELSKYAHPVGGVQSKNLGNIHFTVLCTDGFHVCSLDQKIKQIGFEATQIVVGANIHNFDVRSEHRLEHANLYISGAQLANQWIIFSPSSCFLICIGPMMDLQHQTCMEDQQNKQFLINSQLQFNLHPSFYSGWPEQTDEEKRVVAHESSATLVLDCHKKVCLVVSIEACLCLISYQNHSLQLITRIKLDSLYPNNVGSGTQLRLSSLINFLALARFGVNTSTTNKYENKVIVLVGVCSFDDKDRQKDVSKQKEAVALTPEEEAREIEKQKEKQREKKMERIKEREVYTAYIYSVDLKMESVSAHPPGSSVGSVTNAIKPPQSGEHSVTVLRDFPQSKKIWYCEYLENRLNLINTENQVQMIDLCRLIDGKHMGKQWVNLGYRFEALQVNELYQELEDEFELTAEQNGPNGSQERLNQLNDWSYSLLPRDIILNRRLKKLNCIDL